MRVVHFITRMIIGGAQENTLLTVEDQHRDYGDEVTLVTGPERGPEGSLLERAHAGGFDVRIIPELGRSLHPRRDWISYRRLLALLKEIRPQILHTHSSKAGVIGRAAGKKLGIPVVHTIHGASFHYGQSPLLRRLYIAAEKWAARRTDRFISVCDAMSAQYVAAGIASPEKFVTIYSGMDVEPFRSPSRDRETVRRELGFDPGQIVIGKVARLFPLKGHEYLIQAASAVIAQNPNVRFLLVGDGILREEFETEIARRGLSEHFVFVGLVPPEQVPELIAAMDIVVHTSMWEGLARVLPQGLIAGKPVVSYDIDGAPEVVIPDETGYLLPRGSIERLADALTELAADPDLRERLGRAGQARFTDRFRHQTMTREIRDVYRSLLE